MTQMVCESISKSFALDERFREHLERDPRWKIPNCDGPWSKNHISTGDLRTLPEDNRKKGSPVQVRMAHPKNSEKSMCFIEK